MNDRDKPKKVVGVSLTATRDAKCTCKAIAPGVHVQQPDDSKRNCRSEKIYYQGGEEGDGSCIKKIKRSAKLKNSILCLDF